MAAGRRWVVDLDLEKFFDRVNHDRLMARMARRIGDKRMLKLVRAFLTAGVMEDGLVSPVDEGTPQGGPLSPLLSNIVLDEPGPGVGATRAAVRTVRGRLQHLCGQSPGRGTRDGRVTRFIAGTLRLRVNRARARWRGHGSGSSWASACHRTHNRSGGLHRKRCSGFGGGCAS